MALKLYPVDKGGKINLGTEYAGQTFQVTEVAPGQSYGESEDTVLVLSPVEIVTSRGSRTTQPATAESDAAPFPS